MWDSAVASEETVPVLVWFFFLIFGFIDAKPKSRYLIKDGHHHEYLIEVPLFFVLRKKIRLCSTFPSQARCWKYQWHFPFFPFFSFFFFTCDGNIWSGLLLPPRGNKHGDFSVASLQKEVYWKLDPQTGENFLVPMAERMNRQQEK